MFAATDALELGKTRKVRSGGIGGERGWYAH